MSAPSWTRRSYGGGACDLQTLRPQDPARPALRARRRAVARRDPRAPASRRVPDRARGSDRPSVGALAVSEKPPYVLYVNEARTVLVRVWSNGEAEVALRDDPDAIWGPPVPLTEEPV